MGKREMLDEIGCGDAMVFVNPDFDDAIIGTTDDGRAVYSYSRMVECLVRDDGMTAGRSILTRAWWNVLCATTG